MPAPNSNQEFIALLLKSGILDESKIKDYRAKLAAAGSYPESPQALADSLRRDGLLTRFQADQLLQGKWKRFFIGKYKVLDRLGVGGMGQVFLCEHKLMRRRVAVKVLPLVKAQDESSLERFYREARAIAVVDHPNLVRAYDIDQDENLHFLVMEYVDGTNLHDIVRRFGVMDITRACHYIYGAAIGLQHAHEMGLVHRDIKPANILIDRSGVVKILDLGLARFFNDDQDMLTRKFDENVLGTADFLAPEQAVDSHTVDIRADMYSLGATFYYLVSGRPPFPEGTVAQKLLFHQNKEPTPLQELRADLPEELARIIKKMMAKDPDQRYSTPNDLMKDLAPWVATPIAAPPDHEMPQNGSTGAQATKAASSTPNVINTVMTPAPVAQSSTRPVNPAQSQSVVTPLHQQPVTTQPVAAQPLVAAPALNQAYSVFQTPRPLGSNAPATARPVLASSEDAVSPNPWAFGDDFEEENNSPGKSRTVAEGARSSRNLKDEPISSTAKTKIILGLAVGLLLLLGTVTVLLVITKPWQDDSPVSNTPSPSETPEKTWYVDGDPQSRNESTRHSLAELLPLVAPGDTIILKGDRIESGPLLLRSGRKSLNKVTIRAEDPSRPIVWLYQPSPQFPQAPALDLINLSHFKLQGIRFDFGGRAESGIRLAGKCSGLQISDCELLNAKKIGLSFHNLSGEASQPILIKNTRISGKNKLFTGIQCSSTTGLSCDHIHLENCQFDGMMLTGVALAGELNDIKISRGRFWKVEQAVEINPPRLALEPFSVTLHENTFHQMGKAVLKFVGHPQGENQRLFLSQNLFSQVPSLFVNHKNCQLQGTANGYDGTPGTPIPNLEIFTIPRAQFRSLLPESRDFLRMLERPTVGKDKLPVGSE